MLKSNTGLKYSLNYYCEEKSSFVKFITKLKDVIKYNVILRNKKLYILKGITARFYKDYEESTGIIDIPYYKKTEMMLEKIAKENKIDYYYEKLKRLEKIYKD